MGQYSGIGDAERESANPLAIRSVEVDELFGRYSYTLHAPDAPLGLVSILYGDNGTGKTTILGLLFHLLSSADNRGHRTFIAQTQFRQVTVTLADGTQVSASRPKAGVGTYDFTLSSPTSRPLECHIKATHENKVRVKDDQNPDLHKAMMQLGRTVPVDIYYVSDRRRIDSDALPKTLAAYEQRLARVHGLDERAIEYLGGEPEDGGEAFLRNAMELARDSVMRRLIVATNQSNVDTSTIYGQFVRRVATPLLGSHSDEPAPIDHLLARLREVSNQSRHATDYDVGSLPELKQIVKMAEQVPSDRQEILSRVLEPFVEATEARIKKVSSIQESVATFVEVTNSFLWDKRVSFRIPQGLEIWSGNGDKLPPHILSSGEKHLLLLLLSTLYAQERSTIFLLDEPELSLNVKWQRMLVGSLLRVTERSVAQFVMATHSHEVISSSSESVIELRPRISGSLPFDQAESGSRDPV